MNFRRSTVARARCLAWLALALLAPATRGATSSVRVTQPPIIHYAKTTHVFTVTDPDGAPGERSMAREVVWQYPVFTDARDPATPALNTWSRLESLKLLLGEVDGADRLTDAEIVAKASASQDFIDGGVDQAVVTPVAALGRLRDFIDNGETVGGNHPFHTLSHHLYSLDRRSEIEVAALFKPDNDGLLEALYGEQPEAACPGKSFSWDDASLSDADTLVFEYPYRPGHNVNGLDCMLLVIQSPKVTRLLKSPRSLRPRYVLVEDPA